MPLEAQKYVNVNNIDVFVYSRYDRFIFLFICILIIQRYYIDLSERIRRKARLLRKKLRTCGSRKPSSLPPRNFRTFTVVQLSLIPKRYVVGYYIIV
jgi:hypothetical protein